VLELCHCSRLSNISWTCDGWRSGINRPGVCLRTSSYIPTSIDCLVCSYSYFGAACHVDDIATKVTVAFPQPSVTVTLAIFGAGTVPLQPAKVILAGHVMDGGVVSTVLVYV
jgi:hypothetical protein